MAERVVLHVGLMKSGTTYIQHRLSANRPELARQDICFPGRTWGDQVRATADFFQFGRVGKVPYHGYWERLMNEVDAHPGAAMISMEFFAPVKPAQVQRVADAFAHTDLQIVITIRDLGRNIPAMWQETLKNGRTWTWSEYVEEVRSGGPAGKNFWRQHSAGRIVTRWAEVVGPENVTVITVPRPDAPRELLWERFCEAAGLADPAGWEQGATSNESLGAASAMVMRAVNEAVADIEWREYEPLVKGLLGSQIMAARKKQEPVIGFAAPPWVHGRADRMKQRIAGSGVRLIGDLDDLTPLDVPGVDPESVDTEEQLAAALTGLEGLLRASMKA